MYDPPITATVICDWTFTLSSYDYIKIENRIKGLFDCFFLYTFALIELTFWAVLPCFHDLCFPLYFQSLLFLSLLRYRPFVICYCPFFLFVICCWTFFLWTVIVIFFCDSLPCFLSVIWYYSFFLRLITMLSSCDLFLGFLSQWFL